MKLRSITLFLAAMSLSITVIAATATATATAANAAALHAPDKVKEALRLLAYVQADMASKLPNRAFARLPHENEEFQEAAPALLDAVAAEPAAFRTRVGERLKTARAAANQVAEISRTHDAAQIATAVAAVDAALQPLNELFPKELRPVPGQLGGRPGARNNNGPPPELR